MRKLILSVVIILLLPFTTLLQSQTVLVEAESFQNKGGWVSDQQFILEMGSPYLLAHGLGTPVADATTTVTLPSTGTYRVWVRTKDWVAQWNAPGAPGKFQLSINNQKIDTIFGTKFATWSWQNGGTVNITKTSVDLRLIDLTGFEGRCDAILLTKDVNFTPPYQADLLATWRSSLRTNTVVRNAGNYDLIVVGGGMSGIAASIGAARLGLKVALVQDRPVVGGNNSTEVRVGLGGSIKVSPYSKIGNIIAELTVPVNPLYPAGNGHDSVYDDTKRMNILKAEPNITLFMNHYADKVLVNGKKITAIQAQNTITAERIELSATYFSDCTGDGTIGYLAGADYQINETKHMGNSNLWNLKLYSTPQPFPACPWALNLHDKVFPGRPGITGLYNTKGIDALGEWFWESGFSKNPITQVEYIRDYNFRAMYGAWDCVKNTDKIYPNYKLNWAAYVTGKRESRMLLGDLQLTKEDLLNKVKYPDGFIALGWNMDVHIPYDIYQAGFEGEEFISDDIQTSYTRPYHIPYRCLYSRNIDNLFFAGRNISVTPEALGAVRVMKTTGMMGEVVGLAAGLCKKHNTMPRNLYTDHFTELVAYMKAGIPAAGEPFQPIDINGPNINNLQIIIDNTDAECTYDSLWTSSTYTPGYHGADYMHDGLGTADSTRWAKWTPNLPQTANYNIYMKWIASTNRPDSVPVEIKHKNGITSLTVNQTTNGEQWNLLGKFSLNSGTESYVKIDGSDSGFTIADAVLFEKLTATTLQELSNATDNSLKITHDAITGRTIFNIDMIHAGNATISLYNMYGVEIKRIIDNQPLNASNYSFLLQHQNLPKGAYIARLMVNKKSVQSVKFIYR